LSGAHNSKGEVQVIAAVAAEGGSIVLYGQKDSKDNWMFCRGVADQTPTFLSESDGRGESISHNSAQVKTWEEAIALMDKYPWAMLSGVEVHPEFHHRVWEEVRKRLAKSSGARAVRCEERWAKVCGKDAEPDRG
jgi:hypothetical protein